VEKINRNFSKFHQHFAELKQELKKNQEVGSKIGLECKKKEVKLEIMEQKVEPVQLALKKRV